MQDIACQHGSLKSGCLIDFIFWYGIYTGNTLGAIDFGLSYIYEKRDGCHSAMYFMYHYVT